jgi:carboxypeptidase D
MAHLDEAAESCGYNNYLKTYATYPPPGPLPLPGDGTDTAPEGCNLWNEILNAALLVNPAFNIYRIFHTYPILWDVLGFP